MLQEEGRRGLIKLPLPQDSSVAQIFSQLPKHCTKIAMLHAVENRAVMVAASLASEREIPLPTLNLAVRVWVMKVR